MSSILLLLLFSIFVDCVDWLPFLMTLLVLSRNSVSFGDILWNTTFWMLDLPLLRRPINRMRGLLSPDVTALSATSSPYLWREGEEEKERGERAIGLSSPQGGGVPKVCGEGCAVAHRVVVTAVLIIGLRIGGGGNRPRGGFSVSPYDDRTKVTYSHLRSCVRAFVRALQKRPHDREMGHALWVKMPDLVFSLCLPTAASHVGTRPKAHGPAHCTLPLPLVSFFILLTALVFFVVPLFSVPAIGSFVPSARCCRCCCPCYQLLLLLLLWNWNGTGPTSLARFARVLVQNLMFRFLQSVRPPCSSFSRLTDMAPLCKHRNNECRSGSSRPPTCASRARLLYVLYYLQ